MSLANIRWSTLLIIGLALALRCVLLDLKPPHFDEGVNGWFVDQMTKTGYYDYDPKNYHGPLHFYVLFLAQTLLGRHVWTLRLPIVLVSVATVYLVLLFERFIGRRAAQFAALAMAVSPGAVFYGRYAIHEAWLVFFLVLTVWAIAGLWKDGTRGYLWALNIGLTGAVLTKETYVIHFGCFLLAAGCLVAFETMLLRGRVVRPVKQRWSFRDLGACFAVSIGLIVFFYSGNFLHWNSLKGLYQTFEAWFRTGQEGHGHEKPWYYWLKLMWRYEWLALCGFAGLAMALLPKASRLMRYLAIYGVGCLTAYSIVNYKTPWCVISILWPFWFGFGYLAQKLWRVNRVVALLITGALLGVNLAWAIQLNFYRYTDESEPYVYVQTFEDIHKLLVPLKQLVEVDPANYRLSAHIMVSSYHPLPWLLGDYSGIGYYDNNKTPGSMDADFLLVERSRIDEVEVTLKEDYFTEPFRLRASQDSSKLYLNARKFHAVFPERTPELSPSTSEE